MREFWPFVITGLTSGSLYGLAAMGLVLTYKASGIFNFAHGAVAAAGAYIFFELHNRNGVPWPLAAVLVIFVVAPVAGVVMERLARGLVTVTPSAKIVATVGLLLVVQGTCSGIFGPETIVISSFLPSRTFQFAGVYIGFDQLVSATVAAAAAAGLYALFRFSRLGLSMRGVVDNPDLLDLAGISPARVRISAWMIGCSFAALSGILLAPYVGLNGIILTLLVVQALGAAAVGGFSSLPLTYLGGLVVGVGGALATKYVVDVPSLAGFPSSLPFIVLFAVLLLSRKGRFVEAGTRRLSAERRPLPSPLVWVGRLAVVAALMAVPELVGPRLPVYNNAIIFMLMFLSLRLLVRTSGQVSLCHAAFAAIGAAAFSHLAHGVGLPWLLALAGAGLATVPVGALLAIPAIRLSGLYLALATFGFGVLIERMFFTTSLMFGLQSRPAPRPGDVLGVSLGSDHGYYYVCLTIVVVAALLVLTLNRSRLGRLCRAMAESPVGLATHGTNVNITRVVVFCISAFLAGTAGALFVAQYETISGAGFTAFYSLTWLAVLAIAGSGELSAIVIAAFALAVVPSYVNSPDYTDWQPVLFGALALGASLSQGRRMPGTAWLRRWTERDATSSPQDEHVPAGAAQAAPTLSGAQVPGVSEPLPR